MQYFFTQGPPNTTDSFVSVPGPNYIEFLVCLEGTWVSAYALKVDDNTMAAVIVPAQQYDEVFRQLNDPRLGRIYVEEFRKQWPTFFQLIDNAVDGRYGDGAMAELIDPDDMNRKWCYAMLVKTTGDEETRKERMGEAVMKIIRLGLEANEEFQRPVSWRTKARIGARGAMVGGSEGQAIANR